MEESLTGSCSFRSSGSKESSASSDTGSGEGVGIPGEGSRLGSGVVVVEMTGAAVMEGCGGGGGSGEGFKRRINVHSRSSSVSIVCAARLRAPSAKGSLTWPTICVAVGAIDFPTNSLRETWSAGHRYPRPSGPSVRGWSTWTHRVGFRSQRACKSCVLKMTAPSLCVFRGPSSTACVLTTESVLDMRTSHFLFTARSALYRRDAQSHHISFCVTNCSPSS